MRFAHLADIQIRALKRHDEFEYKFKKLYESLNKTKPNAIFICGDLYHNKLNVSNEYFDICRKFLQELSEYAPLIIIPGNHDMSLSNPGRVDAIEPIVNSFDGHHKQFTIYSKKTEKVWEDGIKTDIVFHHLSILDNEKKWKEYAKTIDKTKTNVVLWHGTVKDCVFQNGWLNEKEGTDLSLFSDFDFGMFGDIHRMQPLDEDGRFWYCGSFIQQNWGEETDKGYLIWDIEDKNNWNVEFVELEQKRYYETISAISADDIDPDLSLSEGSRIRVMLKEDVDPSEEIRIKEKVSQYFKPYGEVIVLPPKKKSSLGAIILDGKNISDENIRKLEVQAKLIRNFLKDHDANLLEKVIELDKVYHSHIDSDVLRNIMWNIKSFEWNNLFPYGKDNKINFSNLNGIVGIFGPNGAGKSYFIDCINFCIFNAINRESTKNINYVNNFAKKAFAKIHLEINKEKYYINRKLEVKDDKTFSDVDFFREEHNENGEGVTDTNKKIRNIFGTLEDFNMISLIPQWKITEFIDQKSTKRLEIFAKFLDLSIFKEKYELAYEDFKAIKNKLNEKDGKHLQEISDFKKKLSSLQEKEKDLKKDGVILRKAIRYHEETILTLFSKMVEIKIKGSREECERKIENVKEKISSFFCEIDFINEEIDKLEKFDGNIDYRKQLRDYELELKELEKISEKINNCSIRVHRMEPEVKDLCNDCPMKSEFKIANEEYSNLILKHDDIFERIEDLKIKIVNCSIAIANNSKRKTLDNKKSDKQNEIDKLKNELQRFEESLEIIKENEESIKSNESLRKEVALLKKEKDRIHNDLSINEQDVFNNAIDIRSIKEKIDKLQSEYVELLELRKQYDVYQLYLKAMGKNGISYSIISHKIPLMNREINRILSQISDLRVEIKSEEDKKLEIYIVNKKRSRPLELAGGFEKTLVSLALRCVLWQISSLPKCPILFLDESFAALDSKKSDKIPEVLDFLRNYFETVFIITHDEDLKKIVDSAIYIQPDERGVVKLEV